MDSLKAKVYQYFREHPRATGRLDHKKVAFDLGLDYDTEKLYLYRLAHDFRSDLKSGQGLKGLDWHHWHGWIYALKSVSREAAVAAGWIRTSARNRYLLWKDGLGRLEWHESGRIKVWIKKPVSEGKKLQLLANAFCKTFLITDIKLFTEWAKTLRMKGVHCAADTGYELPYLKLDLFKETNGIVIVSGDSSHRTSIEAQVNLPDWQEKNELMLQQCQRTIETFSKFLQDLSAPRCPPPRDRSVV
jgi:hypothetical protein